MPAIHYNTRYFTSPFTGTTVSTDTPYQIEVGTKTIPGKSRRPYWLAGAAVGAGIGLILGSNLYRKAS